MSNRVYILLSGILVSLTMIGLFFLTAKLQEEKQPVTSYQKRPVTQVKSKEAVKPDTTARDEALTILNMWYQLDKDDTANGVRLIGSIDNASKIGMHRDLLSVIKKDYKIELPPLDGVHYLLKLEKVEKHAGEEMQIFGKIKSKGQTYFSTISVIENTVLAVLSTPTGDYDLKMHNGKGYVYKIDKNTTTAVQQGLMVDVEGFMGDLESEAEKAFEEKEY